MKITFAILSILVITVIAAQGQSTDRNTFSVWAGGSFAPITAFGGVTPAEAKGRKYVTVGLGYARRLATGKSLSLDYTLEAIPIAIATHDIVATGPVTTKRATSYGFGLVPLGLRANLGGSGRVTPFVQIAAGGMLFNKPVPLPDAGKFAYVLEGGAGVRVAGSGKYGYLVGAKLHHLSNGNRSGANRGLNQIVIYTGITIR